MKFFIFLGLLGPFLCLSQELPFKGVKKSLIPWERNHPIFWMDLDVWKKELETKENNPAYEAILRNRMVKEKVGKVLQCIGVCLNYRGRGFSSLKYGSTLREGDEIQTEKDGYLWIFLFDGTMVRLSPSSSISFKEINLGINEIFHHVRVNYGNVLWLSRDPRKIEENNERETDTLFLPLSFLEANPIVKRKKLEESNLYDYLSEPQFNLDQAKRLNSLIEENNNIIKDKISYSFIVFPNGTVFGGSLKAEFVVLDGGPTYFKRRTSEQLNLIGDEKYAPLDELSTTYFYRGFKNNDFSEVESGFWYAVTPDGDGLGKSESKDGPEYGMGEYITKRIRTILVARELLLKKNSQFMFEPKIDQLELARQHGYRLWGALTGLPKQDLRKRLEFLQEYTRRIETTNLLERSKFKNRLTLRGEEYITEPFSNRFYIRALKDYYFNRLKLSKVKDDRESLNSTAHPFWVKVRHK